MRWKIFEKGKNKFLLKIPNGNKWKPIGIFKSLKKVMEYIKEISGEEPRILRKLIVHKGGI